MIALPVIRDSPATPHFLYSALTSYRFALAILYSFHYPARAAEETVGSSRVVGRAVHAAFKHLEQLFVTDAVPSQDALPGAARKPAKGKAPDMTIHPVSSDPTSWGERGACRSKLGGRS